MQRASAHHRFKFALDLQNFLLQQAAVSFDLGFARTAEEAATTALAFKVGPASDQSALLIIQMRQFDLQCTFLGAGTLTENFQNEPRTVDNLDVPFLFEIALLYRRQCVINNDQPDGLFINRFRNGFHLSRAQERCRPRISDNRNFSMFDVEIDSPGKPDGFFQTRLIGALEFRTCTIFRRRARIVPLRQNGNDDGRPCGLGF